MKNSTFRFSLIAALIFTVIGWMAAQRQRNVILAYVHPVAMMLSYYILLGGLANELFARLDILRPLAVTMVDGAPRFGSRITGMTQGALMLATLALIVLFVVRVALRRHKRKAGRAASIRRASSARRTSASGYSISIVALKLRPSGTSGL